MTRAVLRYLTYFTGGFLPFWELFSAMAYSRRQGFMGDEMFGVLLGIVGQGVIVLITTGIGRLFKDQKLPGNQEMVVKVVMFVGGVVAAYVTASGR